MIRTFIIIKLTHVKFSKIEIGSGPNKKKGWLTLDLSRDADLYWDLKYKMPFSENTFEIIYCSHLLEHFPYKNLKKLLIDIRRVLKKDGQFLIAVPDASIYIKSYLGYIDQNNLQLYKPAVISNSAMDVLNYIFYMDGEHKFMFDKNNLIYHLEQAGFSNCKTREFNPLIDRFDRDYESLYVSCCK